MELVYRKAVTSDLDTVCTLVAAAVAHMDEQGINQWDEVYPSREVLSGDIERGELYVGLSAESAAVIYVVNTDTDEQYANGKWSYNGGDFAVIHRLCVSPAFRHKGLAGKCLEHIEDELRAAGTKAVRLDVFTENPYALRLYENHGYKTVGRAHWRKGEFLLMEKLL